MSTSTSNSPPFFGYIRYAENYRLAAERVIGDGNPMESPLLMPAHNLLALSIELSFKAFLLSVGLSERTLRNDFQHKLIKLHQESSAQGLRAIVALDDTQAAAIATLDAVYRTHEFRYIRYGYKTLPMWTFAAGAAYSLTHGLHDHLLILRLGEEAAKKRIALRGKFG